MRWVAQHWYVILGGLIFLADVLAWKWHEIHQRIGWWGYLGAGLGWLLIFLGLVGGMIPILPGFPLGILGLILLGPNDPIIRRLWLGFHHRASRWLKCDSPRRQRMAGWYLELEMRVADRVFREGRRPPWEEEDAGPGSDSP